MISLLKIALNVVLSSVDEHKKTGMCLMGKICVRGASLKYELECSLAVSSMLVNQQHK